MTTIEDRLTALEKWRDAHVQHQQRDLAALTARVAALEGAPEPPPVDPPPVEPPPVEPPPVDPPPTDPPPPATGRWFDCPIPVPAGAKVWSGSGSLGAALKALKAGETLVLDFDGTVRESINLSLADGVLILPAPLAQPWLDGPLRISGGNGVRFYGLNVRWTNADAGGHMVKLDGGSIDYAYAELAHAACYTLLRPGQAIHDTRIHHLWVHDNPGVSSHNGAQDHGLYCSAENPAQRVVIDHCLVEDMPRGRNIKIGGPGSGTDPIGGITVRKCTLRTGHGPSNAQVSNGATGIVFEDLVLIDSGASTALTSGSGAGLGSTYARCVADRKVGPNDATLRDAGGNVIVPAAGIDIVAQGKAGRGHLAA